MQKHSPASSKNEVPVLLRQLRRWIRWHLTDDPKPTKRPSSSPAELGAATVYPEGVTLDERGGVGLLFTGGIEFRRGAERLRLLALDLDAARDPLTDTVTDWAAEVIEWSGHSYTEVSPSGYGLRVLVLVAADSIPAGLRSVARATEAAPGTAKRAGLQLFGLTDVAAYVTMTGRRLSDTAAGPRVVDLAPLIARWGLQADPAAADADALLAGRGEAPSLDAITAAVAEQRHGAELTAGDWRAVTRESSSEAYLVLATHALRAARGHGEVALQWLLTRTAWGRGEVDDAGNPGKYSREGWVRAELRRIAAKRAGDVDPVAAFEALPVPPAVAPPAPVEGDPLRVLDDWAHDGALVHLPTGIPSIDAATGGGLVLGSRVYLVGAPDAGKTALGVQLLDHYRAAGIPVGILAIDEEPSDVVTRLLQRRGVTRVECEQRTPATLHRARELLAGAPLRVYGPGTTIEAAAVDLHRTARERSPGDPRPPCVLLVDSVQTARAEGEDADGSLYRLVTERVAAIRAAASRYRMLVLATSEMNRGAYRSRKVEEQTADMAAAKESGAIEFSARLLLVLRSVPDVPDVIECRLAKNKHGPSTRASEPGVYLRLARDTQTLTEDGDYRPVSAEDGVAAERVEAAARLALLLTQAEGVGRNAAIQALAADVSERRVRDVRAWLIEVGAIRETIGARRVRTMELVTTRLPTEVRARFEQLLLE